jgi:hypothetical protein
MKRGERLGVYFTTYQHNLKLGIEVVNLKNDSWRILEKIEAVKMGVRKVTGNI